MARPKKAEEERRDLQVNVRLSAIEHAKLASRAAAAGVALADYMRQKSLTGRIKSAPAETASRLQALNRIGNSLYKVSQTGTVSPALATELEALLVRIDGLVAGLALDVG
jgi:hypothetical protein